MTRIGEIEQAIQTLPIEDFRRVADWIQQRDEQLWDRQMDHDSSAGKLDGLFAEADREHTAGLLTEWPLKE
jgi:hypothetical protein